MFLGTQENYPLQPKTYFPASAMKELEELLQKNSAFKSFADLEREMIQHGYLPTIRNPRLRMLIETTGLPVFSH